MKVFTINDPAELDMIEAALVQAGSTGCSLVIAFDDIDQAVKVKMNGRWSPPLGLLEIDD